MSSYYVTTYPTRDGERDVLLVALPSDLDAWAIVDHITGANGLDSDPVVVERRVPDLETADQIIQAHVLLSIEFGYPASGRPASDGLTVKDLIAITAMQRARAEHLAANPGD